LLKLDELLKPAKTSDIKRAPTKDKKKALHSKELQSLQQEAIKQPHESHRD
jgi:hypothetical protein